MTTSAPPRAYAPVSEASDDDDAVFELLESPQLQQPAATWTDFVAARVAADEEFDRILTLLEEQLAKRGLRPLPAAIADLTAESVAYEQLLTLADTAAGMRWISERLGDPHERNTADFSVHSLERLIDTPREKAEALMRGLRDEIDVEQALLETTTRLAFKIEQESHRHVIESGKRRELQRQIAQLRDSCHKAEACRKYVARDWASLYALEEQMRECEVKEEEINQQQLLQPVRPNCGFDHAQTVADVELRDSADELKRDDELWAKNERVEGLRMLVEEQEEIIRELKKDKERCEKAAAENKMKVDSDNLYIVSVDQRKTKEIEDLREKVKKLEEEREHNDHQLEMVLRHERREADGKHEENEEVKELKKTVEAKEDEIKELKEEVEQLRAKKEKDEDIDKEIAEFNKTKQENRDHFRTEYLRAKSSYRATDSDMDIIASTLMVFQLVCSLLSFIFPQFAFAIIMFSLFAALGAFILDGFTPDQSSLQLSFTPVTIAVEVALMFCFHSEFASYLVYAPYLHATKSILLFLSALDMSKKALDRSKRLRYALEIASGIDVLGDADQEAAESENSAETVADPAAASIGPESRVVFIGRNKKTNLLGLVVGRTEDGEHCVTIIMPRGPVERNGRVKIGDEIVSLNDVAMKGATIDFAQFMAKNSEKSMRMELRASGKKTTGKVYYL